MSAQPIERDAGYFLLNSENSKSGRKCLKSFKYKNAILQVVVK
jgi:hypothetical protein